jgi:hypothetical protein
MHYKNGRPVAVGDWVVGKTHNSQQRLVIGIVRELMPQQGTCNVRLECWDRHNMVPHEERPESPDTIMMGSGGHLAAPRPDYADAAELITVADGYRMVAAVSSCGLWDAPYFAPSF